MEVCQHKHGVVSVSWCEDTYNFVFIGSVTIFSYLSFPFLPITLVFLNKNRPPLSYQNIWDLEEEFLLFLAKVIHNKS